MALLSTQVLPTWEPVGVHVKLRLSVRMVKSKEKQLLQRQNSLTRVTGESSFRHDSVQAPTIQGPPSRVPASL